MDRRRRGGHVLVVAAIASLALATSGCSFFFVRRPDEAGGGGYAQANCTSSAALPTVDLVIALLQVVRTVYAISLKDSDYNGMALSRSADISLGLTIGTVFATSAGYGYHIVSTCRELGTNPSPYNRRTPTATRIQRKADEDAEEAAVQARIRARAAAAATGAPAAPAEDGPTVTPAPAAGGAAGGP
ncbi:MAG TPA: hypothetical protein VIF57_32200 [Polyangia bacterium]